VEIKGRGIKLLNKNVEIRRMKFEGDWEFVEKLIREIYSVLL